jgi:hypothetical protein
MAISLQRLFCFSRNFFAAFFRGMGAIMLFIPTRGKRLDPFGQGQPGAEAMGLGDQTGTIAPGKLAGLLAVATPIAA